MRGFTSWSSYRICLVALAVAMPSASRAQTGAVGQGSGAAPRLPANVEIVVNRLVDSARTRGLPADPLVAKAREGALKGADSTRIVNAVRRLLDELDSREDHAGPDFAERGIGRGRERASRWRHAVAAGARRAARRASPNRIGW